MNIQKRILISGLLFFISVNMFAQKLNWAKAMGGNRNEVGYNIITDRDGNVFTMGIFKGTADFDPSPSVFNLTSDGGNDVFITKMTASGNLIWAIRFGSEIDDEASGITSDSVGNIYITGPLFDTVDFNPGAGVDTLIGGDRPVCSNIFILKLNIAGQFQWVKQVRTTYVGIITLGSITANTSGIFIGGALEGWFDFNPSPLQDSLINDIGIFVLKLDLAGTFKWVRISHTSSSISIAGIDNDSIGNVYIAGNFSGTIDFKMGSSIFNLNNSGPGIKGYIAKFNSQGDFVWAKAYQGGANQSLHAMQVDKQGNVYTTGSFEGDLDLNPELDTFYLSYRIGGTFISKLDADGNFVWGKGFHFSSFANWGMTICNDNAGNTYVSGLFIEIIYFQINSIMDSIVSYPNANTFLAKINAAGDFVWVKRMGGNSNFNGRRTAHNGIFDPLSNSFYLTGFFTGTADFDQGSGVYNLSATDSLDVFVSKISICNVGINRQPNDQILFIGSNNTFFVASSSNPLATYQWQHRVGSTFVNISNSNTFSGVTNDTLLVNNINSSLNGSSFRCLVTLNGCTEPSGAALLNIVCNVAVAKQPSNKLITAGNSTQFVVASTNPSSTSYQWQVLSGSSFVNINNSINYNGVTNDTLVINKAILSLNNTNFRCVMSNLSNTCADTSTEALLNVSCGTYLSLQPTNKTVSAGNKVQLVVASSNPLSTFKWQIESNNTFSDIKDSIVYGGINKDTLTIYNPTVAMNNSDYRCLVITYGISCVEISSTAKLNVSCTNYITQQPTNQSVFVGNAAQFTVLSSNPSSTYQWQTRVGTTFTNLINSSVYSGVTNDTLVINNVTIAQNNSQYRCLLTTAFTCNDISNTITLSAKNIGLLEVNNTKVFAVYPNPANDIITLQVDNVHIGKVYAISNMAGQIILKGKITEQHQTIDINQLKAGMYLVQVINAGNKAIKLVKEE